MNFRNICVVSLTSSCTYYTSSARSLFCIQHSQLRDSYSNIQDRVTLPAFNYSAVFSLLLSSFCCGAFFIDCYYDCIWSNPGILLQGKMNNKYGHETIRANIKGHGKTKASTQLVWETITIWLCGLQELWTVTFKVLLNPILPFHFEQQPALR